MNAQTRWYVVHSHAREEKKAVTNLLQQGFTAFVPEYLKRRRHARRTDWVRAPLFPRYLFVAMDVARARWRAISSTIGVSHIICQGDAPAPVPDEVIRELQARLDDRGLVHVEPKAPFRKGELLQVTAGALADSFGLFDRMADAERVILLLDLLGRQLKVKLPLDAVAPIA
jgi:transcriptional antiterminator RfaH